MNIVFYGHNAVAFLPGFAERLNEKHHIVCLPNRPAEPADVEAFQSADVIIGMRLESAAPAPRKLRLFHVHGAGFDAVDRTRLPSGAVVCNCFGHEYAIAEYVMAGLLKWHVPLAEADRDLREAKWTLWAGTSAATRREMGDSTIGILGFGHIGQAVAARAKAFGMTVHVANRSPITPSEGLVDKAFGLSELLAFMGSADSIIVTLPLLPETTGIVDRAALAAMRKHAVIINVGRGPLIDETALYEALQKRTIGGAVIDTWYVYPSADNPNPFPSVLPFHKLDNVILTPHMSGWTTGTVRRRQDAMADNINRLSEGRPLLNVV